MLRATYEGRRVREVPMRLESRRFGESKLKVGDAVMAHARLLAGTVLMVGTRQATRWAAGWSALAAARSSADR